ALIDIIAAASSPSSLAYNGSPQPGGTPSATATTLAPTASPDLRSASMYASSSGTCSAQGLENGLPSTAVQSCERGTTSPIWTRQPRTVTPRRANHFFATTAAATRIVVSRAELRPPPRGSRMPYFCQ